MQRAQEYVDNWYTIVRKDGESHILYNNSILTQYT